MSTAGLEPRDRPADASAPRELAPLLPEGPRSHSTITRVGLLAASAVLFALGVVFWLIPVATGIPFYVLSVITLSMASRRAARFLNRGERRLPYRFRRWMRLLLRHRERKKRHERRTRDGAR
ncbi:MAG: hypothetical protein ACYTCU_06725 [Planctomycetota bacterium]|jgi:hypothetical protein